MTAGLQLSDCAFGFTKGSEQKQDSAGNTSRRPVSVLRRSFGFQVLAEHPKRRKGAVTSLSTSRRPLLKARSSVSRVTPPQRASRRRARHRASSRFSDAVGRRRRLPVKKKKKKYGATFEPWQPTHSSVALEAKVSQPVVSRPIAISRGEEGRLFSFVMERGRSLSRNQQPSADGAAEAGLPEDALSCTVDGGGKVKRGKSKKKLEPQKAQSLEEAQLEIQQHNKNLAKQSLHRSQTFDSERSFEVTESSVTRSSFIKHNKSFHKLFPDIPESEDLIHAYICALQKEVPYHGRLYVSENYVCFYSSVLLKDTKVVIPVSSVLVLKKQNTALLVPNALSIRTCEGEKYLFVSLRNRESCYKLLLSVCPQLEDGSTNSSPIFSSVENSFEQSKHTVRLQSSLEDSFDQLDRGDPSLLLNAQPPNPTKLSRGQ
ncbi:hypothetical protein COCON_G00060350, partial [Conger conger]